ncbi:Scarecrow-like protein 6 [Apostasia shenzhenica]|uniref:Scarecrow-like protein 6 n=1 Tax=Apostasia shenzhenica TaxID=1088818 RepID=A0A2H9ZT56_9ASPA|nr:Scarecrow-like protein 6 [Apostasia shenzhenica]
MRVVPFHIPVKGGLEAVAAQVIGAGEEEEGDIFWSGSPHTRKVREVLEPTSVLDQRRSASPPTSTSTLSSSFGGGGVSTDTAGVAAISEDPCHRWPGSDSAPSSDSDGRKKQRAADLQPVSYLLDMSGLAGVEKCGIRADDWETMLSASTASPSQEQTFLRWIMGDIEDPSAAKLYQQQLLVSSSQGPPVEFDAGVVDPGFGIEPLCGITGAAPFSGSGSAIGIASLASSGWFSQVASTSNRTTPGNSMPCPSETVMSSLPPLTLPPAKCFPQQPETSNEKSQPFPPNLLFNPQQQTHTMAPAFFLPIPSFTLCAPEQHQNPNAFLTPHPKRPNSMPTDTAFQLNAAGASPEIFLRRNHLQSQPHPNQSISLAPFHNGPYHLLQQQALVDQLFKAAELVEAGNFVIAHEILARLNQQLPSPLGMPLLRSAFYFKQALQLLLANSSNPPAVTTSPSHRHHRTPFITSLITPLDVVLKLSAYKAFSEVSPLLHFANFTATQALLEALDTAEQIHIIDFDIGVGGQWSSFMQELAQRRSPAIPLLKLTAFVSLGAFHDLELHLTRENLSHFASSLNIPFEINILSTEYFDPAEILTLSSSRNETIAVNLPVGVGHTPSFSTLLRLVKQLLPKIIISMDQGSDRSDLPFSQHFIHAFQSSMVLLDSIDAAGTSPDMANKIERFVLQPRIENCIFGRHRAAEKTPPWRAIFASAGFVPLQLSNFTETQAECLLKRIQVRGFHVEKRQSSLYLYWQRGELVSVSAWRC